MLRKFANEYFQIAFAKNVSMTCAFNQRNLFNSLIHLSLSSIKKQAFKWLFKILLWREIMLVFIFLIFLVKIWNESNISIPIYFEISCLWLWLFGEATYYQGGEEAEVGNEELISNLCLISHRWYDVEKLTVPGSSNLNLSFSGAQQKFLC